MRSVQDPEELWAFKKTFASQLGLFASLSHAMSIGDRSLHKVSFFKHSARVTNSEFYPSYNDQGAIDFREAVPFRLTRNLCAFLSPSVVDGVVASTMESLNICFTQNLDVWKYYLTLFIRDDLLSWTSTKVPITSEQKRRSTELSLEKKVTDNVKDILTRIKQLGPSRDLNLSSSNQQRSDPVQLLLSNATDKSKLCLMPSTWAPWF